MSLRTAEGQCSVTQSTCSALQVCPDSMMDFGDLQLPLYAKQIKEMKSNDAVLRRKIYHCLIEAVVLSVYIFILKYESASEEWINFREFISTNDHLGPLFTVIFLAVIDDLRVNVRQLSKGISTIRSLDLRWKVENMILDDVTVVAGCGFAHLQGGMWCSGSGNSTNEERIGHTCARLPIELPEAVNVWPAA